MPKNAPRRITPVPIQLNEETKKKLTRLTGYAMMHGLEPSAGRVIRTLIEMTEEGPGFLKALQAVDERERQAYREKRRKS